MDKHIFTFGQHHKWSNRHQVIYAKYPDTAERKMFEIHGRDWAGQYSEEVWEQYKVEGHFKNNLPLEKVYYCEEKSDLKMKMDYEEFMEHLRERGEYNCACFNNPPCSFCTDTVDQLYEEYLGEEE